MERLGRYVAAVLAAAVVIGGTGLVLARSDRVRAGRVETAATEPAAGTEVTVPALPPVAVAPAGNMSGAGTMVVAQPGGAEIAVVRPPPAPEPSPPGASAPDPAPPDPASPDLAPGGTFWDDDGNIHEPLIEAIAAGGITRGCTRSEADLYCPTRPVTRGEMAAFLVRALRLPPSPRDRFTDDDESTFEGDIDALAAAGITKGCRPDRFCPDDEVTRGQMAALLVRAFGYRHRPSGDRFADDGGSIFETDIETLAAAGITSGCNPPAGDRYCPDEAVRRDQMASFLGRALGLDPIAVSPRPVRTLAFTGDTLIHVPVTTRAAGYGETSGEAYDFRPMFDPVRELIRDADLALCHLEVPLTGRTRGISGYPRFSAPPELADALVWAGYDGCSTASNHSVDQGFEGLVETIEVLEEAGLGQAGMAATETAGERITTYDVDGVTVAHLSATYGLNGLPLPKPWAVDLIDLDRLLARAERAKTEGADVVVASIHCCVEYVHEPSGEQVEIHRTLIDSPHVDLVVGHHGHVVQPVEHRQGEYVVYGLGNFLSSQQSPETIDGVLVTVEIARRGDAWAARGVRYAPTWVDHGSYRILPTAESLAAGWPPDALARELAASWRRTTSVITSLDAPAVSPTARP